jgi:hypothetical protein
VEAACIDRLAVSRVLKLDLLLGSSFVPRDSTPCTDQDGQANFSEAMVVNVLIDGQRLHELTFANVILEPILLFVYLMIVDS